MATAKKKQEFVEDMIEGSDAEEDVSDSWEWLELELAHEPLN